MLEPSRKKFHCKHNIFLKTSAEIAQLVEHNLAKVGVASSSLVFRSQGRSNGGIGRHEGLKILWPVMAVRVQVPLRVQDVIAIIGKLMIAIFVLYIHHKITEAEARVSGFSWLVSFLLSV